MNDSEWIVSSCRPDELHENIADLKNASSLPTSLCVQCRSVEEFDRSEDLVVALFDLVGPRLQRLTWCTGAEEEVPHGEQARLTSVFYTSILTRCRNLTTLVLQELCLGQTEGDVVGALLWHCPGFGKIALRCCCVLPGFFAALRRVVQPDPSPPVAARVVVVGALVELEVSELMDATTNEDLDDEAILAELCDAVVACRVTSLRCLHLYGFAGRPAPFSRLLRAAAPQLRRLSLASTPVFHHHHRLGSSGTSDFFAALASLHRLEELDLQGTHVTNRHNGLEHLSHFLRAHPSIQKLELRDNHDLLFDKYVSESDMEDFADAVGTCRRLQHLSLPLIGSRLFLQILFQSLYENNTPIEHLYIGDDPCYYAPQVLYPAPIDPCWTQYLCLLGPQLKDFWMRLPDDVCWHVHLEFFAALAGNPHVTGGFLNRDHKSDGWIRALTEESPLYWTSRDIRWRNAPSIDDYLSANVKEYVRAIYQRNRAIAKLRKQRLSVPRPQHWIPILDQLSGWYDPTPLFLLLRNNWSDIIAPLVGDPETSGQRLFMEAYFHYQPARAKRTYHTVSGPDKKQRIITRTRYFP